MRWKTSSMKWRPQYVKIALLWLSPFVLMSILFITLWQSTKLSLYSESDLRLYRWITVFHYSIYISAWINDRIISNSIPWIKIPCLRPANIAWLCFVKKVLHWITNRLFIMWYLFFIVTNRNWPMSLRTFNLKSSIHVFLTVLHIQEKHEITFIIQLYIDGLVQDCNNFIASPLEYLQPCAKPSISKVSNQSVSTGYYCP